MTVLFPTHVTIVHVGMSGMPRNSKSGGDGLAIFMNSPIYAEMHCVRLCKCGFVYNLICGKSLPHPPTLLFVVQ